MFFTYTHCPGLAKFAYNDRVKLTVVNYQGLSLYLPPIKQLYLPKMVLYIWILNNCIRQYQPNYFDQFYFSQLKISWSLRKLLFRLSTNYSTRFVLRYVWPWLWITPARAFDFSECHFPAGATPTTPWQIILLCCPSWFYPVPAMNSQGRCPSLPALTASCFLLSTLFSHVLKYITLIPG